MPTVKNETTVLNLVFKGFFTSIPPLIFILYAKDDVSRFSVENFLSQCRKISWGTLQCFRKFRVSKNFRHKRVEGGITILRRKIFVSQDRNEKLRRGTPRLFRKFWVSKNFRHKRVEGGITILRKNFCLTIPKLFEEEPFCASENFSYQKTLWIRGGGGGGSITIF